MKIGFDGKRAIQNYTGLGNYSRYIAEILCRFYPENEYCLYAPKKRANKRLDSLIQKFKQLHIVYPKAAGWKRLSALWRIGGITRQLQEEGVVLFHGLSNELPLNIHQSHIKSIVTIHDLIFLRYPEYYHWIDRKIYTYKFRKACENANRIIAISECTKRDIMDFFHIPEEKIDIVYQGCDPIFEQKCTEEGKMQLRKKYQLPGKFILNVGSIEKRKNALLIVKAMLNLPEDIHLVIIGKRTIYTEEIEKFIHDHNLSKRVQILSNIPFNELPVFYQCAEVFTYPSFFEGFGIPIIEALHSEVPVVAAVGSCLEEAGGPDSCYVDPTDVEGLSKTLLHILEHPDVQQNMREKGRAYVKRFSEEEQASLLMNIYKRVLNEA